MLISNRATNILLVAILAIGIGIVAMLASGARGGPLDPPGPPASTDSVQLPGTPITSLPFTITLPGHYYVTRSLTGATGQSGITVSTSNVSIDLGGFTLTGGTTPGSGVSVGSLRNVTIRNGALRGWNFGILGTGCGNCRVDGVQASSSAATGIDIGPQSVVSDCNASLNNLGIAGTSITIRNCTISENQTYGIQLTGDSSLVEDSRVNVNADIGIGISGSRNMIHDNQLSGNVLEDIRLEPSATFNVFTGNVDCNGIDLGTNNGSGTGNFC